MKNIKKLFAILLCFCTSILFCSCFNGGEEYYCYFDVDIIEVFTDESVDVFALEHLSNLEDEALHLEADEGITISGSQITASGGGEYVIYVCHSSDRLAQIVVHAYEIVSDDSLSYYVDSHNAFDDSDSYVVSITKNGQNHSSFTFSSSAQDVDITKVMNNLQIVCGLGQNFDITIKDSASYKAIILHFPL